MDTSHILSLVDESFKFIKAHPKLSCLVLFGWSFLETAFMLGLILPAEKVLILSSILVSENVISPVSFVLCIWGGTFFGYEVSYFLGYFLGEEAIEKLAERFRVKGENLERVKAFVNTKGELSLLFGRFIPVVRPLLPVVIGAFRPNFLLFSVFNALGALLWALYYLLFGNLIGKLISNIIRYKFVGVFLLLVLFLTYLLWRYYGKDKKNL